MNNNQFSSSFEKQPRGTNNGITESISILHVDDEEAFLKATQIYVEESTKRKIKVDSLIDPEQIFRRLEEKAYDVIVADYQMPKMDGLQLLEQLREKNITTPFIILTGRGREEVAIKALNLGANRYIKKGMDIESQFGELIHAIQEVVKHKKTTERLRERELQLRSFMDASPDSFLLFDEDLNLIDLNKISLSRFPPKTKREELLGKNVKELSPTTGKTNYLYEQYQKILKTGESIQVEDYISHPVFGNRTFELRAFKVGNGLGIIATDITERKQKDEDLRESEEKYKMLVEKLDEGVLLEDTEGNISFVNPKTTELLDYTEKELLGKSWTHIVPPESVDKAKTESKKRLKGISSSYEIDILAKDNTLKHVIVSATPIYSKFEEFNGVLSVFTDISERKKTETRLSESEERYRQLFDSTKEGIITADSDGNIMNINPAAVAMLGYKDQKELLGTPMVTLWMNPEQRELLYRVLRDKDYVESMEIVGKKRDGTAFNGLVSLHAYKNEEGNILRVDGLFHDITERKMKEEMLKESEEKYRSFLENFQGIAFRGYEDFSVDLFSGNIEKITGYTEDDFISGKIVYYQLIHPEDISRVNSDVTDFMSSSRRTAERKYCIKDKNGKIHWIQEYVRKFYNEAGGMGGVYGTIHDITERKQVEEALQETEERLRAFIYSATDAIDLWDSDLNLIDCNQAVLDNFPIGTKKETIIGKNITEIIPDIKETDRYDMYIEVLRTGKPYHLESFDSHPKFGDRIFSVQAVKVGDGLGMITRDVTERKQAEEALLESEERLTAFMEAAPDIIQLFDSNLNYVAVNKAAEKELNLSREEIIGKNSLEFYPHLKGTERYNAYKDVIKTGNPFFLDGLKSVPRFVDRSFSIRAFKVGNGLGMIISDVTEQKQAEEALRESEKKYRTILESIVDGYYEVDLTGNFTFFNDSLCKLLGYSRDELMGTNNRQYMDDENAKQVYQTFNMVYKTRRPAKASGWKIIRKDGTMRFNEASVSLIIGSSGEPVGFRGIVRDITERKEMEDALRESKEKYQMLVEKLEEGVLLEDADGIINFVNPRALMRLGYTEEEIIGKHWSFTSPPEDLKRYEDETAKRPKGISSTYESGILSKKGVRIPVIVSATPLHSPDGEYLGTLSVFRDISKQKEAEETLRAVNEELQAFASIVAHDLKSPLSNIKTIVELLVRDSAGALSEKGRDYLNLMVKQTTHMAALIEGIHQYSHIDRLQKKVEHINLKELLPEVIEIISPPANIEITIQTELPVLTVDRTHIIQIFANLLGNAVKFMDKPKGHISINHEEKETYWQFSVKDNGPGIEERQFKRIFQIFQTLSTKDKAKGTGIGLSIVKKIVEMNGGKVWLESTVGEGSTFYFTLLKELRKKK